MVGENVQRNGRTKTNKLVSGSSDGWWQDFTFSLVVAWIKNVEAPRVTAGVEPPPPTSPAFCAEVFGCIVVFVLVVFLCLRSRVTVTACSLTRTHRSTQLEAEGGPAGAPLHTQAAFPASCCTWREREGAWVTHQHVVLVILARHSEHARLSHIFLGAPPLVFLAPVTEERHYLLYLLYLNLVPLVVVIMRLSEGLCTEALGHSLK